MFSEGNSFHYQPSIRDLQKASLILAFDLAKRVDPSALQGLALETVEWFPKEPLFWLNLADTLQGNFNSLVAKRLALDRASQLLPLDTKIKEFSREIGRALGRIDSPKPVSSILVGKPEEVFLQSYSLKIRKNMKLSEITGLVCDLAESILEMHPSKRAKAVYSTNAYKVGLASPVDFIYEDLESNKGKGPPELVEDDASLLLSQAASIKNFNDFSQVSTRSQSRRLREKDSDHTVEANLTPESLVAKLREIFKTRLVDVNDHLVLSRLLQLHEARQKSAANSFSDRDDFIDPIVPDLPSEMILLSLLSLVSTLVIKEGQDAKWCASLISAASRLAMINIGQIDSVIDYYSVDVLVWLLEYSTFNDSIDKAIIDTLLSRIEMKLCKSQAKPALVARFLWAKTHHKESVEDLDALEAYFGLFKNPRVEFLVLGNFSEGSYPVVATNSIRSLRIRHQQADALKQAKDSLRGPEAKVWIETNITDPIRWLDAIQNDKDFCEIALLVHHACIDDDVKQEIILLAMIHALYCDKQSVPLVLVEIVKSPRTFLLICKQPSLLSELVGQCFGTSELFSCIFECIHGLGMLEDQCELVLTMWKDMLLPKKIHLVNFDVLATIRTGVRAVSNQNGPGMILKYCTYRCIIGTPFIPIPQDTSGLVDALGDDRVEGPSLELSETIDLFNITSQLIGLDCLESSKLTVFIDKIVGILNEPFINDRDFKIAIKGLERFVYFPINQKAAAGLVRVLPDNELTRTLRNALKIRHDENRRLQQHKKKSFETIRTQREDLWKRIVLEPDEETRLELFWLLGASFDSFLHLALARDAASILSDSQLIAKNIIGAFNCWTGALRNPLFGALDNLKFGKFLTFIKSMDEGVLSMFIDGYGHEMRGWIRRKLKMVLPVVKSKDCLDTWRITRLEAIVTDLHRNAYPYHVACGYMNSLRDYIESNPSGNPEIIYRFCLEVLKRLVPKDGSTAEPIRKMVFEAFLIDAKATGLFDLPEAETEQRLGSRIINLVEQLGKLDKKRTNHGHNYLLAHCQTQGAEVEINNVRKHWSKLIPLLVKNKNGQLVNIWQSDLDYPGDYLYAIEKYLLEIGATLMRCSPESMREAAETLATIIGRVAVSPNIIIRRRFLMQELMKNLHTLVENAAVSVFLADRTSTILADIHDDALALVRSCGVEMAF